MKKLIIILITLVILVFGGWYIASQRGLGSNQNQNTTLTQTYSNATYGFSIRLPAGYAIDEAYTYQANPTNVIPGVKFTIPASVSAGTNLGSDTYISVEKRTGAVNSCSAEIYLDQPTSAGSVDVGGHRYSVATASGAGAGNRYDETVYATPVDGGCIAVRYFIHSSVFENYPPGTVTRFDEAKLKATFDAIRKTLVLK